jgi:branched-chain amino acid transport system ATP-binding protein
VSAALAIQDLEVVYGSVVALRDVSIAVGAGEIVTLIGANGAGKSSLLRAIVGLARPRRGEIRLDGAPLTNVATHELVGRGVAMVPEGRRIFPFMSVLDNLHLGAHRRRDPQAMRTDLERVYALFPRMAERRAQAAGSLSGGEQQMVAIGRALMSRPRLLLLDEPSLGLAPMLVREIGHAIRAINRTAGVSVLLVEQNARMALSLAARAYVLETGRVALAGPAADLRENDHVRRLYLGG